MRHNLSIRVSDKPQNGGVVACRTVNINVLVMAETLRFLAGSVHAVTDAMLRNELTGDAGTEFLTICHEGASKNKCYEIVQRRMLWNQGLFFE